MLEPGKPTGMYHAESSQEDFLVLAGTCLLLVEEQERPLRAWDFVHCPPGTRHSFVGTGDEACVIFMTGARRDGDTIVYPLSKPARARNAGVETETDSPADAYAPFAHWRLGRPDAWADLPCVSQALNYGHLAGAGGSAPNARRTRGAAYSSPCPRP